MPIDLVEREVVTECSAVWAISLDLEVGILEGARGSLYANSLNFLPSYVRIK